MGGARHVITREMQEVVFGEEKNLGKERILWSRVSVHPLSYKRGDIVITMLPKVSS